MRTDGRFYKNMGKFFLNSPKAHNPNRFENIFPVYGVRFVAKIKT